MWNRDSVKDLIIEYIKKDTGLYTSGPNPITEDSKLIDGLGMDSLDLIELAMALEDTFQITVSDEETDQFLNYNVKEVISFVCGKLQC